MLKGHSDSATPLVKKSFPFQSNNLQWPTRPCIIWSPASSLRPHPNGSPPSSLLQHRSLTTLVFLKHAEHALPQGPCTCSLCLKSFPHTELQSSVWLILFQISSQILPYQRSLSLMTGHKVAQLSFMYLTLFTPTYTTL